MTSARLTSKIEMNRAREIAEPNIILRALVGSRVHGLAVEGTDDIDQMGICVEPWQHHFGLRNRFEQWVYRTQPEGVRSGPGDLDLTIYGLSKWARLAIGGNPTILIMLFVPEEHLSVLTQSGSALRAIRHWFIGNNIYGPYLGYMEQQRRRLMNNVKRPSRPELIERYGYDTKYAGHLLRLGYQGIELAETGTMTLPMAEPARSRIMAVRNGEVSEADVLEEARELEEKLKRLRTISGSAPVEVERIEDFVIDCYMKRHRP